MKRFGSARPGMHRTDENQVFLMHLQLLSVMVRAALKGYPVGDCRKTAVIRTAGTLHKSVSSQDLCFLALKTSTHLFRERVRLLCIMATAMMADGYPMGIHRRQAILENIEQIEKYAFPENKPEIFHNVLCVA